MRGSKWVIRLNLISLFVIACPHVISNSDPLVLLQIDMPSIQTKDKFFVFFFKSWFIVLKGDHKLHMTINREVGWDKIRNKSIPTSHDKLQEPDKSSHFGSTTGRPIPMQNPNDLLDKSLASLETLCMSCLASLSSHSARNLNVLEPSIAVSQ